MNNKSDVVPLTESDSEKSQRITHIIRHPEDAPVEAVELHNPRHIHLTPSPDELAQGPLIDGVKVLRQGKVQGKVTTESDTPFVPLPLPEVLAQIAEAACGSKVSLTYSQAVDGKLQMERINQEAELCKDVDATEYQRRLEQWSAERKALREDEDIEMILAERERCIAIVHGFIARLMDAKRYDAACAARDIEAAMRKGEADS